MVEEILLQFLVFDCASVGYHQVAALDEMDVLALLFEVAPSGQNQQNHNYSDHATWNGYPEGLVQRLFVVDCGLEVGVDPLEVQIHVVDHGWGGGEEGVVEVGLSLGRVEGGGLLVVVQEGAGRGQVPLHCSFETLGEDAGIKSSTSGSVVPIGKDKVEVIVSSILSHLTNIIVVFELAGIVLVRRKKVDFIGDFLQFEVDSCGYISVALKLWVEGTVVEEVESELAVGQLDLVYCLLGCEQVHYLSSLDWLWEGADYAVKGDGQKGD